MQIRVRSTGIDPLTLQGEVAREAVNLLLALVALGTIEKAQAAPPSPELGLFAEAVTALARRYLALREPQDPLGLPPGYVEFLYDPRMPARGSTNYQQVLAAHLPELEVAELDEQSAETALRNYEQSISALTDELREIDLQTHFRH
jgi:hypothetical protein